LLTITALIALPLASFAADEKKANDSASWSRKIVLDHF